MRVARIVVAIAVATVAVACSSSPTRPVAVPLPGPDRAYAVSAPPDTSLGGPATLKLPDCAPNSPLQTLATTRIAADGVLGLVTLRAKGCALETDPSTIRLVGRGGEPLPVVLSRGNLTDPAGSKRPDIAQNAGNMLMGFAWTGSYCGRQAVSVRVTVLTRTVLIPLQGPVPACRKGVTGRLVPGVLKEPGQAVEPAPVAWGALHARVVLPATTGQVALPLVVVITNSGKTPVSLADPCPDYITTTSVAAGRGHGNVSIYGGGGDLCSRALIVKPGTPMTLKLGTLPFPAFSDLPRTQLVSGDPVTVTWSMAGVPQASATARIR